MNFVNNIAQYLYSLTPDREVESLDGNQWHGFYDGDLAESEGFEALSPEDQESLVNSAAAIIYEDSKGFVDVELFKNHYEATGIWEEIEDDNADSIDGEDFEPGYLGDSEYEMEHGGKVSSAKKWQCRSCKALFTDAEYGRGMGEGQKSRCPKCGDEETIDPDEVEMDHVGSIEKESYTNTALNEIKTLYSAKPGFPKTDEEVDTLLKSLETLLPQGLNSGKQKFYLLYLCKNLFGLPAPNFILTDGEDAGRVKETLSSWEEAQALLPSNRRDISKKLDGKFQDLSDAMTFLRELTEEKEEALPTMGILTPEEVAKVDAGAKVIASVGGWDLYEIKQGDPAGPEAGLVLGDNKRWGVQWCVGRDVSYGKMYMPNGDFWFFVKNGRSKFAMSSIKDREATIWDASDKRAWESARSRQNAPKNVSAKAQELGATIGSISTLPSELVPILTAGVQVSEQLAKFVPASELSQDTTGLDTVIKQIGMDELISDINSGGGSNVGPALVSRAIALKRDFTGKWDQFSEDGLIAFINAWALSGAKALPPDLEQALIDDAPNFTF